METQTHELSSCIVEAVTKKGIKISGISNVNWNNNVHYLIYKLVNIENGMHYIGQHKTLEPLDDYMGSGVYIRNAVDCYGPSKFIKQILFDFDNFDDMNQKEQELVPLSSCHTHDPMSYNLQVGGCTSEIGHLHMKQTYANKSEEEKLAFSKKMSELTTGEKNGMFGYKWSNEQREHQSNIMRGKSSWCNDVDEETQQDFKRRVSEKNSGKNNGMYGKNSEDFMTPEAIKEKRKKLSEFQKGSKTLVDPTTGNRKRVGKSEIEKYLSLGYIIPVKVKPLKKPKKKIDQHKYHNTPEALENHRRANTLIAQERIVLVNKDTGRIKRVKAYDTTLIEKLKSEEYVTPKDFQVIQAKKNDDIIMTKATMLKKEFAEKIDISQMTSDGKIMVKEGNGYHIKCLKVEDNPLLKTEEDIINYKCLIAAFRMFPMHVCLIMESQHAYVIPKNKNASKEKTDSILAKNIFRSLHNWIMKLTSNLVDTEDFHCHLSTRCAWIFQGLSDYKKCLNDNEKIMFNKNIKISYWYSDFCSVYCKNTWLQKNRK